jgi:hypothetical protein
LVPRGASVSEEQTKPMNIDLRSSPRCVKSCPHFLAPFPKPLFWYPETPIDVFDESMKRICNLFGRNPQDEIVDSF